MTEDPTGGPAADEDDRALLAAHVAGDPDAFGTLFGRHRDRLWAVALRTTGNREDAADALQDAMISAFRRAETFRGDARVTTWLHRIVVNACLDRIRRRKARPTSPLPEHDTVDSGLQAAEDHIEQRETQILIAEALAELPDDQREAVILVDIEGWPIDDAARMLNCPSGTVKSRCSRGRAKLAKRLVDLRNPQSQAPVQSPEGGQS